jgi:hypothetical protein
LIDGEITVLNSKEIKEKVVGVFDKIELKIRRI